MGGHVRAVFTLITIIFVICVTFTVTSFKEIPLKILGKSDLFQMQTTQDQKDMELSAEEQNTSSFKSEIKNNSPSEQTPLQVSVFVYTRYDKKIR